MLPRDDDRRTYTCCAIIIAVPAGLAAAQATVSAIVERWATGVGPALPSLAFFNAAVAGAAAAWAAVLLPGGRTRLNIAAAISAFIVGAAIYAVAMVPCAVVAEIAF